MKNISSFTELQPHCSKPTKPQWLGGVASATPQWFRDSSEKKVHPKLPLSQPNLEGWDEPKTFQKEKAGVQQADIL